MNNYFEIDELRDIYLEDSFVLSILELDNEIRYEIEFVLTENHPHYSMPSSNERYCYKKGFLIFQGVKDLVWKHRNMTSFLDAKNEIDYGHIDYFNFIGHNFKLNGDWGSIMFYSTSVVLIFSS